MPFYESNEDTRGFQADSWAQGAQGRVADQWAASAVADAPDRAAAAEQAAQQAAQQQAAAQAAAQAQAQAEAQRQAEEQARQQAEAAAQAAQQRQAAADQWAGQAHQQAASVASTATDASSLAPSQMPQQATIDSSSPEAFIRSITPWAQQISQQTGIPAAAMIGMAANETGYGKFAAGNNLFGIKGSGPAGSINSQTWEDYGSGPVTIRSNFRAYANPGESFQDFADLVTNAPRYAAAKGQTTVEGFVQALKDGGYMTDPAYVGKISSIVQRFGGVINDALQGAGQAVGGAVQGAGQAAQDAGAGAARVVQGAVNTVIENLRPSQFAVGLDSASAYAACGPVAAIAFARAIGRNPTAQEAVQLAKQVGWTAAQGMAGPGSELSLLTSMGVPAHMENGADVSKMATDVGNGNPVIISTPGHYFVADGYDPQSGAFHVGTSGTDLRRGSEWMTLGQMQNVMGNVQATLFLDRQPGDGPSIAAQARGQQPGAPGAPGGQPVQPRAQTMADFINQRVQSGQGMPTDTELGNFILSQPPEQTAASVGQPQPIQQPSSPFDVVGNIASGLGGAVSGAVSGVGSALGGLFGRGGPGGQPPPGPTETAPVAATSSFPGLPQLPTGMPSEGGGYGAGGPLLPGEAASAFAPVGQAVTGLATSPYLPTNLTNAGLQALRQNVVAPGLEAIAQPGGLLAGPRAAAAGGLEGLAGQVPAGVPVVGGVLEHAAGIVGGPTIIDQISMAQELANKYPSGVPGLPDPNKMTPEDKAQWSNIAMAVGGVTLPPGPEAGGTAAERAAAEVTTPVAPAILERFGLTDRPVEGVAPLSDDDLLSHYQGLEQQYEANNVQIARLADQLHEARNPGVAPIRPQWAVGLPNESVIKIANDHGVSPYREDWWEQAGLSQGSQEVSRMLSEGGYRGVGTRRLGGSQLQNAQAELDRLRAENQAITDHLDPLTAAEPGTLYRAPAIPAELPFAPPTDVVQSASREPTTPAGAPTISPPTPVGGSEAIAATTPADLGVRESPSRVGAETPAAAPVSGTAGGNLPVEQLPEVQRVRQAATPPLTVNPADNGIPPPPGEPPRPVSTNPDDFDANVRAAVEQEAKKPGSFWQVLNAFHSGNVVMGPFTLGKVAANTMFQPVWNFGTQTGRDLLTLKPDRVMGRSIGAQQALVSIGSDFMDAFAQAMANRTTSSIPMVDHFLQAQHAVGGALHAGMQNVAAEAVRRMELGAAAGEQVAAQGGRGVEGIGKIADLIRDSSGLSDDAVFRAADMADRAGLRSPAGAVQQTVQNMLNQAANTPVGAVANFLLPVFRIGAQAAARGIEASPFGLIGTGIDVARAGAGFGPYAKGFSQYGQAVTPLADRLTSNIAGTALTAFLASKSLDGTITGTGPDDPRARANLEAQGWRPESVLVPGVGYVSFTRLPEQLRTPLELAGAYGDAVREHPDDPQGIAGRLAQEVGKTMAQGLPGLSTLADLGGILKGDPYAVGFLVGGSAAGYIPGSALLGNVATAMDPLARKIPTTEGFGPAIVGNLQQGIPGLREQLQARTSVLGQPMPNPAAGLQGLLPWRTPGEIAPGTPGLQALRVLNANGVTLGAAPKTVTLGNGSRVDLTEDEQQQYEADRAVLLDQMTSGLVSNQQFAAAPGAARKQVLDRLIRQADAVAGRQVVGAIAQGGDFASRLQGPKRLQEPTPVIRPPLALTELNSAAAPAQASSRAALPLTSDLATLDPVQQEQLRRQLAGTP